MKRIQILDCTLRDGGYINNWKFGYANIKDTVERLIQAGIDIIETGYLSSKGDFSADESQYSSVDAIKRIIPADRKNTLIAVMINCGDYDADLLPEYDGTGPDCIRVCFHKSQALQAVELCRKIKEKGYKVYFQPMVALSYSDAEYLGLIGMANKFRPDGFYIVDSHGSMKQKDVARFFYLIENNLERDIAVGFHSHNNLQLSYSNAQYLSGLHTEHDMIIDSSIMGMGRGAGNLNTELFVEYLNETAGAKYRTEPILCSIDNTIVPIYMTSSWGYSLSGYLSAKYRCHQNYARFLNNKNTLTFEGMNAIFSKIEPEKRDNYDRDYIDKLYTAYMSDSGKNTTENGYNELFGGRNIVIIAPGRTTSVASEQQKVFEKVKDTDAVVIAVNHNPDWIECDYVFVSNIRRYEKLGGVDTDKLIITSNINGNAGHTVGYEPLLCSIESVRDNVTLMLITLLIKSGANSVFLAGVDGYSFKERNFAYRDMETYEDEQVALEQNKGISAAIAQLSQRIPVSFITRSLLEREENRS
ncbi:MAG: aldolase catalytic domain-containing protein [Ruminiclostridium sp.]